VQAVLENHFVRGGISGLGIVNLCAGLIDLGALLSVRRLNSGPTSIMRADGNSAE
jgi:hypothetical protein